MLTERYAQRASNLYLLAIIVRLLVIICMLAGPGTAAAGYDSLELAIVDPAKDLSKQIELEGRMHQHILVTSSLFVEEGTTRHVPLSQRLSTRFIEEFRSRGLNPILPGKSEETAMSLQGTWRQFDDKLFLSIRMFLSESEANNLPIAAESASVDDDGRWRKLLEHDLASLGDHVVMEFHSRVSSYQREHRNLHVGDSR